MWLIRPTDVGDVAFRRMLRDGVIMPVLPGVARAHDIPDSPGLRAAALAMHSRPPYVVSGLAALWVHTGAAAPGTLDLVAGQRHHARSWRPTMPVRIHASSHDYPSKVAPIADAAVDSLRWCDLSVALPRVYALLCDGRVDAGAAVAALDRIATHDRSRARAWSAWGALRRAQGLPIRVTAGTPSRSYSGRRAPVIRRAS